MLRPNAPMANNSHAVNTTQNEWAWRNGGIAFVEPINGKATSGMLTGIAKCSQTPTDPKTNANRKIRMLGARMPRCPPNLERGIKVPETQHSLDAR